MLVQSAGYNILWSPSSVSFLLNYLRVENFCRQFNSSLISWLAQNLKIYTATFRNVHNLLFHSPLYYGQL